MPEDQKSSFSEAVETGASAAHTIRGAIKTGKAISSAAKGAAAGGASLGEGLIDYKALELQKEGKSLEEVAQWVEENKLKICHFFMVEDLNHLQKGGRISKTAAVLGTMVQIKPIIYLDNEGKLQIIKKERGRKKAMNKIVDMAIDACEGKMPDMVMIPHGNCPKDAEYVAELVRKKMGVTNIMMNDIGTVIGGHTGPGMVAVVCMGVHR